MKKYLLAAAAAAAIASPAAARDGSGYVGVEGGVLFAHDEAVNFNGSYSSEGFVTDFDGNFRTNYGTGIDLDLIAGYDFGMFRLEGELGWKKAHHKSYDNFDVTFTSSEGDTYTSNLGDVNSDGKTTVTSAMLNGLLDFGDENGVSFSAGAGIGWAHTKYRLDIQSGDPTIDDVSGSESDSGFAWQILAGIRYAISPNMDIGLKYRYFHGNKVDLGDSFLDANTRFKSHSILASLIYNFGSAPPPPPPPPPPAPERG